MQGVAVAGFVVCEAWCVKVNGFSSCRKYACVQHVYKFFCAVVPNCVCGGLHGFLSECACLIVFVVFFAFDLFCVVF